MFDIFNPPHYVLIAEHFLLLLIFFLLVYGLPSIVAYTRDSRNLIPIVWCNVLLGWTGIVWIVVLIWALNTGSYEHDDNSVIKLSRKFKQ
jgi:hypothetical protein